MDRGPEGSSAEEFASRVSDRLHEASRQEDDETREVKPATGGGSSVDATEVMRLKSLLDAPTSPAEKNTHQTVQASLDALGDQQRALSEQLSKAKTPAEKDAINAQLDRLDEPMGAAHEVIGTSDVPSTRAQESLDALGDQQQVLAEQLSRAKTPAEKDAIQAQLDKLDEQMLAAHEVIGVTDATKTEGAIKDVDSGRKEVQGPVSEMSPLERSAVEGVAMAQDETQQPPRVDASKFVRNEPVLPPRIDVASFVRNKGETSHVNKVFEIPDDIDNSDDTVDAEGEGGAAQAKEHAERESAEDLTHLVEESDEEPQTKEFATGDEVAESLKELFAMEAERVASEAASKTPGASSIESSQSAAQISENSAAASELVVPQAQEASVIVDEKAFIPDQDNSSSSAMFEKPMGKNEQIGREFRKGAWDFFKNSLSKIGQLAGPVAKKIGSVVDSTLGLGVRGARETGRWAREDALDMDKSVTMKGAKAVGRGAVEAGKVAVGVAVLPFYGAYKAGEATYNWGKRDIETNFERSEVVRAGKFVGEKANEVADKIGEVAREIGNGLDQAVAQVNGALLQARLAYNAAGNVLRAMGNEASARVQMEIQAQAEQALDQNPAWQKFFDDRLNMSPADRNAEFNQMSPADQYRVRLVAVAYYNRLAQRAASSSHDNVVPITRKTSSGFASPLKNAA